MNKNQFTLELFVICLLIGVGTPFFALLGYQHGRSALEEIKFDPVASMNAEEKQALLQARAEVVMGNDALIQKGKEVFQGTCIACHGVNADGLGPASAALNPKPRNFQDPSAVWKLGTGQKEIYQAITNGIAGTGMAGFSSSISFEDRWAIVHYLASLPGAKNRTTKMDLSTATEIAGQE